MKKVILISFVLLALVLSGCTQPPANTIENTETGDGDTPTTGYGTLVLNMTDAKIEGLKVLNVTVSGVEVHMADAAEDSWVTFSSEKKTFDLMQLHGVSELIGEKELEEGQYTQIRLSVTKAELELEDGNKAEVEVPSEKIKVVREFTIGDNQTTELTIDFDPESVKLAGDKYKMTPVLKLLNFSEFRERQEEIENGEEEEEEVPEEQEGTEETGDENAETSEPEGETGNLAVYLKDKPISGEEVETLNITFSSLEAHKTGGEWFSIVEEEKTFDLLKLTDVKALWGDNEIEAGMYTMLRLNVVKATLTLVDSNEEIEVEVPSGKLRFNHNFTIDGNETTELLIDFLVDKSLNKTGNGEWKLKPVVSIITLKEPEEVPEELCGNSEVDENETCANCPADVVCIEGTICVEGQCVVGLCGNGVVDENETCTSCPADVTCAAGTECSEGVCIEINLCGNGILDASEICDSNGNLGCDENTMCATDCSVCE